MAGTLDFLSNQVWRDCSLIYASDTTSLTTPVTSDTNYVRNIVGGPRHLEFAQQSGTGNIRLVYANTAGVLNADMAVLAGAHYATGQTIKVYSSTTDPTNDTALYNSSSHTLVGPDSRDLVVQFTAANNKQNFNVQLEGSYAKKLSKAYFGQRLTFNWSGAVGLTPLRKFAAVSKKGIVYQIRRQWSFPLMNVSRSQLNSLELMHKTYQEPIFIYDALGYAISYKLIHGMIIGLSVGTVFNDVYSVNIDIAELWDVP